ncbi:hypothetical protein CSA37_11620 [Candidatus Fermentibacteria bacterium]|nr:MAG: hypothetical protein CSA37_11620 [Candidatus Fermentibacteria bacterium]
MKKGRRTSSLKSSSRRSSSSKRSQSKAVRTSSSSKGSSLFRKKPGQSFRSKEELRHSSRGTHKMRRKKAAAGFTKPSNSPGDKIRPEVYSESEDYGDNTAVENQSGGKGCCGSITGMFTLIAILAAIVVIVFMLKCF